MDRGGAELVRVLGLGWVTLSRRRGTTTMVSKFSCARSSQERPLVPLSPPQWVLADPVDMASVRYGVTRFICMLVAAWVDIREAMMVMSATHHAVLIALAGGGATAHTNGDLVLQCQREASPKFAQGALRHATGEGA